MATETAPYKTIVVSPRHSLTYPERLTLTGTSYADSLAYVKPGDYLSCAADDLFLQLVYEQLSKIEGKDPRLAPIFNDLFGRNGRSIYQHMATALRVPPGYKLDRVERDEHGQGRSPPHRSDRRTGSR